MESRKSTMKITGGKEAMQKKSSRMKQKNNIFLSVYNVIYLLVIPSFFVVP